MKHAVILHGTGGSPEGNWFRWLEAELKQKGFTVWLPQLPHADKPSLREWVEFVQTNAPFELDQDVVIIGHSSGASLALLLAQASLKPLGAVVAVAPFVPMPSAYTATMWDANVQLFEGVTFDWQKIKSHVGDRLDLAPTSRPNIFVVHSDDDPYIPVSVSKYIVDKTGAEQIMLPGQGHFNLEKSEEYHEFWVLLGMLMKYGIVTQGLIQIVDEQDRPLRGGTKLEAQTLGLWHRIVKVLLRDAAGNVLLQRRSAYVATPGVWDFSASGHVDVGEDYLVAALRELQEEIGVKAVDLHEIDRIQYDRTDETGRIFRRFAVTYTGTIDHDYACTLDPREVSEIRWFAVDELKNVLRATPTEFSRGLALMLESDKLA